MRMRKLLTVSIVLILATAMVLSGCNQPATTQPNTPAPATDKSFYGAWPYSMPPKGHFNEFATDNLLNSSPYQKVMYQPLAIHETVKDNWLPILATEWKVDNAKNTVTVKLRSGVKWSDGTEFTSKDVVDTMMIDKARNLTVWSYLTKVEATDKSTVVYTLSNPSTIAVRYILSTSPKPSSLYGKFAEELKPLFDAGKDSKSDEVKKVMNDKVTPFRPEKPVVTGAYTIDPKSITDAQLTMVKNPTAWNAAQSKFEKIVIYCGETEAITPLVLQKKIDFATHAFPVATDQQMVKDGIRVIRFPFYTGPALFFKHDIYPLNLPQVRQAFAYAINRDETGTAALGKSGIGVKNMTGLSDNLVGTWVDKDVMSKLNNYAYDLKKAEELLKGLKFTKGADGIWVDDKGKKMEYELLVPGDYADWMGSAENAATQWTKFGIKVTVRPVPSGQQSTDVQEGKFQLAYRPWGVTTPHPHFAYNANLRTFNYPVTEPKGKGMNFPMVQKYSGGEIDFDKEVINMGKGLDQAEQKKIATKVAQAFNELLPIVPLFERYGNGPALDARVKNWPADGADILKNAPSDHFLTILLLTGGIEPK